MLPDDRRDDGQAEAAAPACPGARLVDPEEALEDPLGDVGFDARTVVADLDDRPVAEPAPTPAPQTLENERS
mgnify:CR=1 FL=1